MASHQRYQRGDVDKAFAEADVVVEREYRTPWVHQSYMEPQVCAATVDAARQRRGLRLHAGHVPHPRHGGGRARQVARRRCASYAMPVGGGFGGKFGLIEPLVAACAVAVGKPGPSGVHPHRGLQRRLSGAVLDLPRQGGRPQGRHVHRAQGRSHLRRGRQGLARPPAHAALCLGVFYRWENLDIDATEVVTHKTPTGAYRAPGLPQAMFAAESLVDELTDELGMDPMELRKKNAARGGDIRPDGTPWPPIGLAECLERAEPIYRAELAAAGPNEGVGVALGGWFGGTEPSVGAVPTRVGRHAAKSRSARST